MTELLRGAVKYATGQGARVIEGYPIDMLSHQLAGQTPGSYSGFMGIASNFRAVGFEKVVEASETQLIMRFMVKDKQGRSGKNAAQ